MRSSAMIAATLLLAGCATAAVQTRVDDEHWDGRLSPQGGSNVRGVVAARSAEGRTTTTVWIERAVSGSTHPWHIHRGKCGSNGPIVGAAGAYPPLMVGSDGRATATALISVDIDATADDDYYVKVHASPQDMGTIIACGELDD